ncbi:MAG: hypothetical protein ABL921_03175 [Pirellula sp.]
METVASLQSGLLSVCFYRVEDRLGHAIGRSDGLEELSAGIQTVLQSIEGSHGTPWPTSPPMQQVVSERIGHNRSEVLLGIGLSGNGHWSSAIESLPGNCLKFDVACKNSKRSNHFGSRYELRTRQSLGQDARIGEAFERRLELELGEHRFSISVSIGKLRVSDCQSYFDILPDTDPGETRTHRWCYEISTC